MIKISPSVLACDFSKLADEIISIEKAGADMVHLDVMDGIFVNNITFGMPIIKDIRKVTDLPFDVHLMIDRPERYIDSFIDAGADIITIHLEACKDTTNTLKMIKNAGKYAAVSIKPDTLIETVYPYLPYLDMVLVMTVEPGRGGQALIPSTLLKVKKLSEKIKAEGLEISIQVDGGVNENNAKECVEAGANVLVAGSAIFKYKTVDERKSAIEKMKNQ